MILRATCPCGSELGAQDDAAACAMALAQFHGAHAECRAAAAKALQDRTTVEFVAPNSGALTPGMN